MSPGPLEVRGSWSATRGSFVAWEKKLRVAFFPHLVGKSCISARFMQQSWCGQFPLWQALSLSRPHICLPSSSVAYHSMDLLTLGLSDFIIKRVNWAPSNARSIPYQDYSLWKKQKLGCCKLQTTRKKAGKALAQMCRGDQGAPQNQK